MLQGIARLAIAAPRRIIAVALLVMVGAAIFGIPATEPTTKASRWSWPAPAGRRPPPRWGCRSRFTALIAAQVSIMRMFGVG